MTAKITQEKEKLQEENYFINLKYQELKTKHSELLKMYRLMEEKIDENCKSSRNDDFSLSKEGIDVETPGLDHSNFKINDNFDFSPYNFKRAATVIKTTRFSHEKQQDKLNSMKTLCELNPFDVKEIKGNLLLEQTAIPKQESNDQTDKDSYANNTSVLTNSDISKIKPEIMEGFQEKSAGLKREFQIDMKLIKQDKSIIVEEIVEKSTSPTNQSNFNCFYYKF